VLVCQACGDETSTGKGWRAHMTDFETEPEIGIFCGSCAESEFDATPWYDPDET
jgi:hypothetical protein